MLGSSKAEYRKRNGLMQQYHAAATANPCLLQQFDLVQHRSDATPVAVLHHRRQICCADQLCQPHLALTRKVHTPAPVWKWTFVISEFDVLLVYPDISSGLFAPVSGSLRRCLAVCPAIQRISLLSHVQITSGNPICSKPDCCSWLRSSVKPGDFWDLDDCKPSLQTP